MRALLVTLVVGAVVLTVALLAGDRGRPDRGPDGAGARRVALRPVPAPRLTPREINRQDPPDRWRQREEAHAFDTRPLLSALPTVVQGVRFEIGGLADDGRTTVIHADASGRGDRRARVAFDALRRRTGDRSHAYWLKVAR